MMATQKRDTEEQRRAALRECMVTMAGAYGRDFNSAAMEAYWLVIGAMPAEQLRAAFHKAMAEEKFCPSPASIRQHARAVIGDARPSEPESFNWPTKEQAEEMKRELKELRREWARKSREVNGDWS
jgi:hypothetical protein